MRNSKPAGWNQPLSWQDEFLSAAIQRKMISEGVFFDLCDAFYGPKPRIQPLPLVVEGDQGFQLDVEYVRNWSPWLDLYIVLRTVRTVLLREGAY